MEAEPAQNDTVTGKGVLEKYTAAGKVAKTVLQQVIAKCIEGGVISEICEFGDNKIEEECALTWKNKKFEFHRGIAFPTCISVNEVCGHYSPLKSETAENPEKSKLKNGDVVKM